MYCLAVTIHFPPFLCYIYLYFLCAFYLWVHVSQGFWSVSNVHHQFWLVLLLCGRGCEYEGEYLLTVLW